MALRFEQIDLEKQSDYSRLFSECPQKSSDYSFSNLWSWADEYGLVWSWTGGLVWIKQTIPKACFWAPVGNWENTDWEKRLDEIGKPAEFTRVPETLADMWRATLGPRAVIEESREHWDYLYNVADLVGLKGNRFHKKKNLLNQFKKKYDYQYLDLDERLVELAFGMQENWCTWRDCEAEEVLDAENAAITNVLSHWEALDRLLGGAITVDGEMVAYTIGERFSDDTLLIHFEKGSPGYKGVYQAINQMFLENVRGEFEWVNREQDLNNEGLRKAKMSYNPVGFVKKYTVQLSDSRG